MNNDTTSENSPGQTGWPEGGEVSILDIVNTVLRHWRVVVLAPLLFALLVGLWTLSRDRRYVASVSFISSFQDRAGAATGLAREFGLNLGLERPGQSPQFYVELLNSRAILRNVAESEYQVAGEGGQIGTQTLIELLDVGPSRVWLHPWQLAVEDLRGRISSSVDRQTGMVEVSVWALDPRLAEQIAERLLDLLIQFNIEARQHGATEESLFIGDRVQEAANRLLEAEEALQRFLQQNREFRNSPELLFEHGRLERQVAIRQEVYTALLRSHEEARIDAVRDTPPLTVIDHPVGSARPQARGTVLRTVLAYLVGITVCVFILFSVEIARRQMAQDRSYSEFKRLCSNAWSDVRAPKRWFRGEG